MSDRILPEQLRPGDVFLYHGTGFISDMIRLFDGSDYSHASMFNGEKVIEAIGSGIQARDLKTSVVGAKYVDVFRFIAMDGHKLGEPGYAADPILVTAAQFVTKGERYAYEQIVLLALLAGTRRLPAVSDIPFLRWMLRNILDNAAEVINKILAAGKEPMICSELVYRCYTQSGPQYDIIIRGADTLATRIQSTPPLATSIAGAAAHPQDSAVIQEELDTFMTKYALAKRRNQLAATGRRARASGKAKGKFAPAASAGLGALAVADFVTPRDLRDSPDLYKVGTLQA